MHPTSHVQWLKFDSTNKHKNMHYVIPVKSKSGYNIHLPTSRGGKI